MPIPADLTLHVSRLVQQASPARPVNSPEWFLVPAFRPATWAEARALLTDAPKPLIVAPLVEPGLLGVWEVGRLKPEHRAAAERAIATQVAFHTERIPLHGLSATDTLSLTAADGPFTMSVAEFIQWSREYATPAGVSVTSTPGPGMGQILVRPAGGGGPPLEVPPAVAGVAG